MKVPEKWRPLAHEWVDGAEIQSRKLYWPYPDLMDWVDSAYPSWADSHEYRRKPKAKVKKWRWVYIDGAYAKVGITSDFYSESEASCRAYIQKIDSTEIEVDEE